MKTLLQDLGSLKLNENQGSRAKQIYSYLKIAIIQCKLKPFDIVSENEVANLFHISRQPVREALIKLAHNDFVTINPKKATRVCPISKTQVEQGCIIRQALEGRIIQECIQYITNKDLQVLEDIIKRQESAAKTYSIVEHFCLDDLFHKAILEIAKFNRAFEIVESVKGTMDRVRYLSIENDVAPIDKTCLAHRRIFEALKNRDKDKAKEAIDHHMSDTLYSLRLAMDKCAQEYFCN